MKIHELTPATPRLKKTRVGRGNASGKGTTAGRGTKGQKARSGANSNIPRGFDGGSSPLIRRLPKLKGFKSHAVKPVTVSTNRLKSLFTEGRTISLSTLLEARIITPAEALRGIKLVGTPLPGVSIETDNPKLTTSKQLAQRS
jgi:large subunit ribosomal protein L15